MLLNERAGSRRQQGLGDDRSHRANGDHGRDGEAQHGRGGALRALLGQVNGHGGGHRGLDPGVNCNAHWFFGAIQGAGGEEGKRACLLRG